VDRDTSSDGERRVPVDVHAAVSDGDHAGCDGVMRLTAVKGVSCSHSAERQHLENTHHVSNLSGENVDPNEQPRHSELLQGRSASEIASLHGRGDNDFSDGVMESDSQLDRTATTVVTTKDFTAERDGRNRCYFDVVGSTCHQVVCSSDQSVYDDDDDDDDHKIQYYTDLRETPTPQFGLPKAGYEPERCNRNQQTAHSKMM